MNYREFSAQIKAKYPQYVDMDDRELASSVLEKHPQYQKLGISFDDEQDAPPEPQQPQRAAPIWSGQTGEIVPENVAPYYAEGARNLVQKPFETLFPGAASVEGRGFVPAVKRNVIGATDILGWPDRAIDYVSGGALERGMQTIREAIDKIPGQGTIPDLVRGILKTGTEIAASPSTYVGAGTIKNLLTRETPETMARALAKKTGVEAYVKKGVDKGIKPTVKNKSSYTAMRSFDENANVAVRTIAENKNNLNLVDEFGEKIARPRSAAEMAQAIEQTKKNVYKQYHQMAVEAGEKGAQTDISPVIYKLQDVSGDIKYNPQIREYARKMVDEVSELQGAIPDVIESRIKDLNSSLAGFYDGRVTRAQAQIDASVANMMREQLDNTIMSAVGDGYQGLKNKYGALKAIEKEVNHRAIVNARRASKGIADLTDIFTGGDLISGVLTMNPAAVTRGVAGRGIKEIYKTLNNPDRYINEMFKKAYVDFSPPTPKSLPAPKRPGMLGNERGAIGGVSDDFVGTPAIRDPKTGKVYTGGWRGHKDAITKGENSAIQERLKHQHFLDNVNKPTENVGFIDKRGNFISRKAAEEMLSKPRSMAQMYHNIGTLTGTAGAAAVADRTRHTIGNLINEKRR
jgi:cell fate (sporulation/competence/biofilm development) regulator YmcA (YheA/YmcA/DUF963 family)